MTATVTVLAGDMRDVLGKMIAEGEVVQSIVTDPPYGLEFMGKEWDAPWQVSSKSALFGDRKTKMPGWGTTRNPNCRTCGGRLRGAKKCGCATPNWDEAPNSTMRRQMAGFQEWFQECAELMLAVLPPGGHLLVFGGTRTYHRMAVAIEEAGFEIRDTIAWLYGSGFPKSLNVSKAIDKAAGVEGTFGAPKSAAHAGWIDRGAMRGDEGHEGYQRPWMKDEAAVDRAARQYTGGSAAARQWDGWGTALKPAMELICVARKPLDGTIAANVLKHGTGALNIDGCRVQHLSEADRASASPGGRVTGKSGALAGKTQNDADRSDFDRPDTSKGRWPPNVAHDGSDEVVRAFPESNNSAIGKPRSAASGDGWGMTQTGAEYADSGSAARFFYSAKADADDRLGSKHPTIKPVDLMRWLVRLVTPPGGTCLDPFAGSGTTGMACMAEGFDCILVEREAEYVADIKARIAHVHGDDLPLFSGEMLGDA